MSAILNDLNPQQKQAVTTTEGPLLIIAGAGTGKTSVIARRIAYIIEQKLAKPSEILALTFTDKAAAQMEERVDLLVPYGFIDTWIYTFHAFGDRVLRDNALDIGLSPDFKILSRPQQVLFFQQNLFKIELDYWRPLSNPTKFISAMLSFFSRLKDENITPEEFGEFAKKLTKNTKGEDEKTEGPERSSSDEERSRRIEAKKYQELADAYDTYERLKTEAGFLDFGDQVAKAIELFKKRPKILADFQKKFKYVLVDEYQDTNYAQNILVQMLASYHNNICVVGDDDQSIYKFRGAAISNILEFEKSYPKTKQVVLTQNYRSTQSILNTAYKLICHNNPDRLEVQNKIDKKLKSQNGKGIIPQEIYTNTISEEADAVAHEIEKLVVKKHFQFRDFAILVRTNAAADHFLRALNMKAVPYKFVGSSGLYQQEEIKLLISFLGAISNFEESLNLFNLMTSDLYQLPTIDAIKLTSFANRKTRSLFYVLKNIDSIKNYHEDLSISDEAKAIIDKIISDLEAAIELSRREPAGKVLYDFLKRTNYLMRLERENTIDAQIKIQNIAKFFEKVSEFTNIVKAETVSQFVEYLESIREAGDDPATVEYDPELDAVNVMTVHGAKGLEFPVVFMVNLVSDRFPSRYRSDPIEMPEDVIKEKLSTGDWHIGEERRLFYVGVTRAKEYLYFSWSRDIGGSRMKKISPFVLEALDKPKSEAVVRQLSPNQKIEEFAPKPPRATQAVLFDTDVLKLTQGSIDDYLTCAYKYRYAHLLRLPLLRNHAIIYGAALHAAVAEFFRAKKRGQLLTVPQVLEVFEHAWDSEGFLTAEHEEKRKNQGKLALQKFWEREKDAQELPTLIEQKFDFSIKNIAITGRFDRVDIESGSKITITDFKSSENVDQEKANMQARESTQLGIYALYYWKRHKIIPQKVQLYFLENGMIGSFNPTEKDLEKVEKLVLDTAENIRRDHRLNHFEAKPKYFGREPACNYCAYNTICPFSLSRGS